MQKMDIKSVADSETLFLFVTQNVKMADVDDFWSSDTHVACSFKRFERLRHGYKDDLRRGLTARRHLKATTTMLD